MNLPASGGVVEPRTVVVSMLVGITVTVVAAWLPARRAAKVAPIEAMPLTDCWHPPADGTFQESCRQY